MTRRGLLIGSAAFVLGGLALAGGLVTAGARPDCPGKITCPQTGEQVCRDRCPLLDPDRPDCPGKIACPLTGERVCRDRCPVQSKSKGPACCTGGD